MRILIIIFLIFLCQTIGFTQAYESSPYKIDSLISNPHLFKTSLDSTHTRWLHKIDSLIQKNSTDTLLTKQLNKFKRSLDSLKSFGSSDLNGIRHKTDSIQSIINQRIDKINSKLNSEFLSSKQPDELGIKLPEFSLPTVNIRSADEIPTINSLNTLNGFNLPTLTTAPLNGTIPKLTELKLPQLSDQSIPQLQDLNKVSDNLQLNNLTNKLPLGASDELNGGVPSTEKLEGVVMQNLKDIPEIRTLEQQTEMLKKWNSDPRVQKEMLVTQAKEQVINHFAGHEQELKAVMGQLSKLKLQSINTGGVVDLYRKKSNLLKSVTIRERFIPEITFQTQIRPQIMLDINPSIGFRLTSRFSISLGWVERISYDWSNNSFISQDHLYGGRIRLQYLLKDNFGVLIVPEFVSAFVQPNLLHPETAARQWIWGCFTGLRKDFNLRKKIKGNVQTLYNLYNPYPNGPYANRLVVRMGIEMNWSKKRPNSK